MNRIYKTLTLLIEIIFAYITLFSNIKIACLSKTILNISCPACGLTRAFKSIIKLDIIKAIKYNYLSIIVLIFLIILNYYLIYDIITNKKQTNKYLTKIGSYYIIIIIILLITLILNNIRKI